jgi:hypothetical protein
MRAGSDVRGLKNRRHGLPNNGSSPRAMQQLLRAMP